MRNLLHAVPRVSDLGELFHLLHRELSQILDATGFLLGLYDESSQMVQMIGQMEAGVELPGGSFPLGSGFFSDVIRTRQSRHIQHWSMEGPRVQVQYATGTPGLPESTITVPLLLAHRVLGVLSIQSYTPAAYDDEDLITIQALAPQISATIAALQPRQAAHAVERISKLEAVLASISEGLLILDADGRIESLNPPAREIFGPIGDGIILGQRLDDEQSGQWPLGVRAVVEALAPVVQALRRGESCRDIEIELSSQGRRILSFSATPLCDGYGGSAGGVVVIHDVTTQRDIARMKDELLSVTSHDLRTPLTVLRGQAQLLQRALRQNGSEQLQNRIDLMLSQTDRLTNMLNRLLDLTKVEAGRLDLRLERMDLVSLIRTLVSSIGALSANHCITVQAPQRLEGDWDEGRLGQVLQNLITNAIKYSPAGGSITIAAVSDDREVRVSVCDTGVGIPASDLPHVFDRFYRVAGTSGLEGSGLGLYICQGIVAAHGGRIWAESDGPGGGATFTFALPLPAFCNDL
jgi:signal transduction histidine kinase